VIARWKDRRGAPRGQAMTEMALILPVLLLIVVGTLEFGFAFDHQLTLEYASREGARTGAALSNGDGDANTCATIDAQIIAAVQRVLTSPGSDVDMAEIPEIRIYKAGNDGQELGPVNRWVYSPGNGPEVDGAALDYEVSSANWLPCNRVSDPNPDSIGVSLTYTYRLRTPLTGFLGFVSLPMSDYTVMALSPTDF
jgi:TadE-like protein